jgi:uncharacterized protein (DUF362 family)
LTHSAAAAGMLALGGGQLLAETPEKTEMIIARWAGQAAPEAAELKQIAQKLTEKAIDGLGGMGRFVSGGDVVWVKPNIGWDRSPEQAANTNPEVVATLVRMCYAAGAKVVKVGDNPCDIAAKTYEHSGIARAAREAGAKVLFLDRSRAKETAIGGERVKSIPIFPEILECDLVINVPLPKHHVLAKMTLCMKNYMGVIEKRNVFHQGMAECIADITRFMKPRLCVVDAMRILKAHGPKGGNLSDVELKTTVAAGVDILALDAFGDELMGHKPTDIPSIVCGQKAGLGKVDYRSLALRELSIS